MSDGHGTFKILKYELDGKTQYQWGTFGTLPGEMWGVDEFTTDQQGNLYTAEVFSGRPQKFRPKAGAHASRLVGKQMRVAWQD